MEDAALLTLEMFKKRLVVLNANLEKLEKLCTPLGAPPTGLLRLDSARFGAILGSELALSEPLSSTLPL
jgi:hypothetical protein